MDKRGGPRFGNHGPVGLMGLRSHPLIFFAGGDAAPDVPLGLVFLQYGFDLLVKGVVEGGQTLAQVLMYRRFADAEFFGGCANSGLVIDDV